MVKGMIPEQTPILKPADIADAVMYILAVPQHVNVSMQFYFEQNN